MPKVTVLMSTYNGMKYLKECMDSIVNQTLKDIEIVIVDDASTDATVDFLKKNYISKYDHITLLCNTENYYKKKKYIKEQAIPYLSGDYIFQMDQDDVIDIDLIEKLYRKAIARDADAVFCDYRAIRDAELSKEIFIRIPDFLTGNVTEEKRCGLLLAEALIWGTVIKKSVFGAVISEMQRSIDIEISTRMLLKIRSIEKVTDTFYYWRQNNDSMSRDADDFSSLVLQESALAIVPLVESETSLRIKKALYARFIRYYYTNSIMRHLFFSNKINRSYLNGLGEKVRQIYPKWMENDWICDLLGCQEYDLSVLCYMDINKFTDYLETHNIQNTSVCIPETSTLDYVEIYTRKGKKIDALMRSLQGTNIAVWGAGERGIAFANIYSDFLCCFVDQNESKQGKVYQGLPVYSYENVAEKLDNILITNSGWYNEICDQIKRNPKSNARVIDLENYIKYSEIVMPRISVQE